MNVDVTNMDPIVFASTYNAIEKTLSTNGLKLVHAADPPYRIFTECGDPTGLGFETLLEVKNWLDGNSPLASLTSSNETVRARELSNFPQFL